MIKALNPRFRPLRLALMACAITSCSDADILDAERVGSLTQPPPVVHVTSHDASTYATSRSEPSSGHRERGGGVHLLTGIGSVW